MKIIKIFAVVIFIMGSLPVSKAQTIIDKSKTVDYEALAQKLVNQCAKIHEGEIVFINGGAREIELLEDIAINVRKLGAFPLVTIGSDRMTRRMYTEVPVKYDSQIPELSLKLLSFVTAIISVDYSETTGLLADIPPERFITIGKTSAPVNELLVNRNVKGVTLGNGLYPTEAQAKQFGLTQKELSDIFWNGVNVDYPKLEATGKAVKTILSGGKEVQITNANGTDIKMRIENRQVLVSDGSLSDEDLQRGYAASQVYLPAGEVFLAPVSGTAEGKVVVDRLFYQDKEITGLTLTFQKGKLTSMTAKSGIEPFKAIYDAAESGKEEFAYIDLGINPDVHIKSNSKLVAWMPAGMITVGIGNNIWAGGGNKNPFGYSFFLPGSTIKVDGKILVENGILKN
ncbi:MAG: aminopeptidase [Bacteroidia bacterium]|nr:aminopeptidase [Bacteroidia bacterium]